MMKRKIVLAGVLALSVMIFASLGLAAAQNYYYPNLETKGNGVVWYFCTKGEDWGFNGKDVKLKSIVCTWWGPDDLYVIHTIKPLLVLTTKDYVILIFCPRSLPDSSVTVSNNAVDGMLRNGDSFTAAGPGWAPFNVH